MALARPRRSRCRGASARGASSSSARAPTGTNRRGARTCALTTALSRARTTVDRSRTATCDITTIRSGLLRGTLTTIRTPVAIQNCSTTARSRARTREVETAQTAGQRRAAGTREDHRRGAPRAAASARATTRRAADRGRRATRRDASTRVRSRCARTAVGTAAPPTVALSQSASNLRATRRDRPATTSTRAAIRRFYARTPRSCAVTTTRSGRSSSVSRRSRGPSRAGLPSRCLARISTR